MKMSHGWQASISVDNELATELQAKHILECLGWPQKQLEFDVDGYFLISIPEALSEHTLELNIITSDGVEYNVTVELP